MQHPMKMHAFRNATERFAEDHDVFVRILLPGGQPDDPDYADVPVKGVHLDGDSVVIELDNDEAEPAAT